MRLGSIKDYSSTLCLGSKGIFLAKALFDNVAETPDELAFRRGDVLTVIEQDTRGLEGWWLCSLRGKQGIAPGNRLKILSGMGDCTGGTLKMDTINKNVLNLYHGQQDYDVPPDRNFIAVGSSSRRPSYDLRNTPGSRKASLVGEFYDTPPTSKRGSADHIDGIYDTPPNSIRASSERTPPHSNRSSASRDSGSNLLAACLPGQLSPNNQQNESTLSFPGVVTHRSRSNSSENCYETPPGSNRSSLERILSEEGPPIYESISPANSIENLSIGDPVYDTPPARNFVHSQTIPVSQMNLCPAASSESLLSNTSGVSSICNSQATSLPDSARSSMDLPSEVYDVPPSGQESQKSCKQLSLDSGLGFYASPVKSRPSSSASNNATSESLKPSQSLLDCKPLPSTKDITRSKSLENAVDDFYDSPKNNAPKISLKSATGYNLPSTTSEPSGLYDIPPLVTRDSVISMKSDSSDENQRLSSSSFDNEQQLAEVLLWDELLLDLDSALELLVKRQQDVSKAASRLTNFVNSTWRSQSSLEKTLYDIKASCTQVRNSLRDFVDFTHGAMANAVRIPDYHLTSKLHKYLSPIQSTLELINKSFFKLEEMKWQVSLLAEPIDKSKPDDLSQIALVSKDLMPEVKKVASVIQSSGSILFKKVHIGDNKKTAGTCKPPAASKAVDILGVKGSSSCCGLSKNMQHRPLPAVPGNEKCPPTQNASSLLDKPKPSKNNIQDNSQDNDYVEYDEIPSKPEHEQERRAVMEQCVREYDYIQMNSKNSLSKSPTNSGKPEQGYSKLANKDVKDHESKNKENKISNKNQKDFIKLGKFDDDVDVIPVKERISKGSSEKTDTKIERKCSSTSLTEKTVSDDSSNFDILEEDLKTPVNVNSSEDSNFILPTLTSDQMTCEPESLDPNDRQVLVYYIEQMNTHSTLLANAIDAFVAVAGCKEPPNVFISHSKFVIVSAHKLVHIGDSIHRNLVSNSVSMRIMKCANHLCDCLKASVSATKTAALQYPSAPAVQEMVDRVIAVSHAAHELKLVITQAAN